MLTSRSMAWRRSFGAALEFEASLTYIKCKKRGVSCQWAKSSMARGFYELPISVIEEIVFG